MKTHIKSLRLCAVAIAVLVFTQLTALAQTSTPGGNAFEQPFMKSGLIGKWNVVYAFSGLPGVYEFTSAKSVIVKYTNGKTATGVVKLNSDGIYEAMLQPPYNSRDKLLVHFKLVGDALEVRGYVSKETIKDASHAAPGKGTRIKP